jgi:uncharacterized repeat protein (TIGR01451 family)
LYAVTKRSLALALGAAGLAASAGLAAAALHQGPDIPIVRDPTKVTICHATASETNPYVQEQVDDDSIVKEGHGDHPDDIIPPFSYEEDGETQHYPGKNWNAAGEAILLNGCNVPEPPKPTPPPALPIQPLVKCVDNNGPTFTAIFGYSNPNTEAVTLAAGSGDNSIEPGGNLGQPSTFQPGTVESAVTVTGDSGSNITWRVTYGGATSSASATASFPTHCSASPPTKVTICHATSSDQNPYDQISVDDDSIVKENGHDSHPKDIIPPFDYVADGVTKHYEGKNWNDAGMAIWNNGCNVPGPTPPTPTPKPISVSPTCIEDRGKTFDATFGYVNHNDAPVNIPVGPDNNVTIGVPVGQPTTFAIGPVTKAFTVTGVPTGADVKWRVTYAGDTSVAKANEAFPTKCGVDPPETPHPYRIGAFVTCVTNQGSTYSATFGYENEDTKTATIAVGPANRFLPAPDDRGQPTTFQAGNVPNAVTVTNIPAAETLTWSLTSDQTRTAKAAASAGFEKKCAEPAELVPIGIFVTCVTNHGDTYDAVFGYSNDNLAQQIVPLGLANTFVPAPGNRGQPTTFEPGTVRNAVTVRGIPNGSTLVWNVDLREQRVAVANESVTQKCNKPPLPPDPPLPEPEPPLQPPDPAPLPPGFRPPQSGLSATCVLRVGSPTTYDAIFGYANASQEDVIVPIGSRNLVTPAPADRGQPTVFRPGVVLDAFTVENVPRSQELRWTVRLPNGEARTATASAQFPRNCITAPAPPSADLVVSKSVSSGTASAGQRVTYSINVFNRGPNIALKVKVVDNVDPRLELLSATTTRGTCVTSGRRVTCTIAELPPGVTVHIAIAVRVLSAGEIRNVAVATHSRGDPTKANNGDGAVLHATGEARRLEPGFTG